MKQVPLMFLGDSPSVPGGLSRIGRDLAIIAAGMEEFRVGFLGRGGLPSVKLPFAQYNYPEYHQWGETYLQDAWEDFSQGEKGVVMTIWDPSRVQWLGNPVGLPNEGWLRSRPFDLWGYFPIDATGPQGKLTSPSCEALRGFNRVLAYGMFGAMVLENSLSMDGAIEFLPHGINMERFQPRDGKAVKVGMKLPSTSKLVGVVMTNQERKDWGLAFEVISLLVQKIPDIQVWCKTDSVDRYWDMRALAYDFGVWNNVNVDLTYLTDQDMSFMYSACDCTFLPSLGEGFGYPIVESLACGTPCVHGYYAGGAELVPNLSWLVKPIGYRYETRYNCRRPVYSAVDWVEAIMGVLEKEKPVEFCRDNAAFYDWQTLKEQWVKWFKEGVASEA